MQQIKAPAYPRGMTPPTQNYPRGAELLRYARSSNASRLIHDDSILLVAGQSNSDLAVYKVQSEGGECSP